MNETMGNQQETITQFEFGWLIGIFDGEGCYSLQKQSDCKITPGIKFVNTNLDIIEEVSRLLRALQIPHFIYDSSRTKNQGPAKRLEINGLMRIKKFLDMLYPYMKCRIDQATVLKQFVELRLSKGQKEPYSNDEHSLYWILRGLNKRGVGSSETER